MNKFKVLALPYTKDLFVHYQKLSQLPGFVLLETSDKERGRYDIVSAYPYDKLSLKASSPDLISVFEDLAAALPKVPSLIDLPFQGGVIGYFSYDLSTVLAGIPLKAYPKHDFPLVDLGFYDWAIISDHFLKKITLFAAHTRPETAAIVDEILNCWQGDTKPNSPFHLAESFIPLISPEAYQSAFMAIQKDLQEGRSYQVNYTQLFEARYEGDPWEMYRRVRAQNPVPYSAFLRQTYGDILSFSPERFIKGDNNLLLASPIKGTSARSKDKKEDERLQEELQQSSKNRAENTMIVDLLRNDLGKIAEPGSVKVKRLCAIESYPLVHHLVSDIEAHCAQGISPLEVFKHCFPAGSITGAPKLETMHIIAEQEPYNRGIYCGNIGYFSRHGNFDSNIAIRTLMADGSYLRLGAGGGIVIDSVWEEEYRECLIKIAAILENCEE